MSVSPAVNGGPGGVSSDDLSGATSGEEHLERDEMDPDKKGAK